MTRYTIEKAYQAYDVCAEEGKRHGGLFQRLKRSFISKAMVAALATTFLFYPVRRATADEINKILELGPIRVEIIKNKMGDEDAKRLLSYSKSLLDEGKYEEAKKILEAVKIYNANKDILDDAEYYTGKIYYDSGEKYKTLELYKKICYLYPKGDVVTSGKLARTLANIIKNETEIKDRAERYQPNFTSSTYAFQILKYDYPRESLEQRVLAEAKDYIDKMLDMDIDQMLGIKEEEKFSLDISRKAFLGYHGFWEWYHINEVESIFSKDVGEVRPKETIKFAEGNYEREYYGKSELLWRNKCSKVAWGRATLEEKDYYWWHTRKGATLRKILEECTSLDPYSWTRQSSKKDIFE